MSNEMNIKELNETIAELKKVNKDLLDKLAWLQEENEHLENELSSYTD